MKVRSNGCRRTFIPYFHLFFRLAHSKFVTICYYYIRDVVLEDCPIFHLQTSYKLNRVLAVPDFGTTAFAPPDGCMAVLVIIYAYVAVHLSGCDCWLTVRLGGHQTASNLVRTPLAAFPRYLARGRSAYCAASYFSEGDNGFRNEPLPHRNHLHVRGDYHAGNRHHHIAYFYTFATYCILLCYPCRPPICKPRS